MTSFARISMAGAACFLALAATAPGAAAQNCADSDTVTAINACYTKLLNQADAEMQAKYQEVEAPVKHLSILDQQLAKSQEDWVAYRNDTCDNLVRNYWLQGQLETANNLNCKLALTRERTSDLANLFQPMFGTK